MKKSILFPILAGAVIVLAVLLAISNDGNKKLNRRIAKYDIDIARLQERNDKLNEDIETQDSSIIGLQKLAEQYENQLSDARRESTSIKERWAKEKHNTFTALLFNFPSQVVQCAPVSIYKQMPVAYHFFPSRQPYMEIGAFIGFADNFLANLVVHTPYNLFYNRTCHYSIS